jgi:hypothetical protein
MPTKKAFAIVAICSVLVLAAFVALVPTAYSHRPGSLLPPTVIRDHHGSPERWIAALIGREGGLPKGDAALTHYTIEQHSGEVGLPEGVEVYTVDSWQMERITLRSRGLLPGLLMGEAAYTIEVEFRVHYSDGDEAVLQWDTWRYGWCFGPLAIDTGGGPAGDLSFIWAGMG